MTAASVATSNTPVPAIAPAATSSATKEPPPAVAGRVTFSNDLNNGFSLNPSVTTDHRLVACLVRSPGEVSLEEVSLLVRRVVDDEEQLRFELVTGAMSHQFETAQTAAAAAAVIARAKARLPEANQWLSAYAWEPLSLCGSPSTAALLDQSQEIACRAAADLREVTLDMRELRVVRKNGTTLHRNVGPWFPWILKGDRATCRTPELEAWARPKKGGPLIVFTHARMSGTCGEPMSDMHVLQVPP
jgi:hypothetical protein